MEEGSGGWRCVRGGESFLPASVDWRMQGKQSVALKREDEEEVMYDRVCEGGKM